MAWQVLAVWIITSAFVIRKINFWESVKLLKSLFTLEALWNKPVLKSIYKLHLVSTWISDSITCESHIDRFHCKFINAPSSQTQVFSDAYHILNYMEYIVVAQSKCSFCWNTTIQMLWWKDKTSYITPKMCGLRLGWQQNLANITLLLMYINLWFQI